MGDDRYQRTKSGITLAWTISKHRSLLKDVLDAHSTSNEDHFLDRVEVDIWRRPDEASSDSDKQFFPNYFLLLLPKPLRGRILW